VVAGGIALVVLLVGCASRPDDASLPPSVAATPTNPATMAPATPAGPAVSAAATASTSMPAIGDDGCFDRPADGVTIEAVHVYQSVSIPLVEGGTVVDGSERTVDIVAGKDAVIAVDLETGPDWSPRPVAARISVLQGSGDPVVRSQRVGPGVDRPTAEGPGDAHVDVPADEVRSDTKVAVTVVECTPDGLVGAAPDGPTPTGAWIPLTARETGGITMHLIPFDVGGFVPSTAPAVLEGYRAALLAMYPVTDVEITVGDVVDGGDTPDLGELLVTVGRIRDQDRPPKDVYYYGLVSGASSRAEYCDDCVTGTSEAGTRSHVGFAIGAAFADQRSEETLLHELGHAHGLGHAPCGDPDMVDETFPYEDGGIGVPGFDRRSGAVVPETASDLMGYCFPRWISDHHYQRLVDRVAEVNQALDE
jgi:hypothetical protein